MKKIVVVLGFDVHIFDIILFTINKTKSLVGRPRQLHHKDWKIGHNWADCLKASQVQCSYIIKEGKLKKTFLVSFKTYMMKVQQIRTAK